MLGPEDLSGADMAAVISEVLGIPVRYQQIPGQASGSAHRAGISDAMAQGMLDMMIAKDNGLDNGVSRGPGNAIDTPTTFRQWCADTLKPAVQAAYRPVSGGKVPESTGHGWTAIGCGDPPRDELGRSHDGLERGHYPDVR